MVKYFPIFTALTFRTQRELALENLVLRQQLAVFKAHQQLPRLTDADRLFWVMMSQIWRGWCEALIVVKPETVIRWHRQGFKYYYTSVMLFRKSWVASVSIDIVAESMTTP